MPQPFIDLLKESRYQLRMSELDENRWHEFEDVSPADTEQVICSFLEPNNHG